MSHSGRQFSSGSIFLLVLIVGGMLLVGCDSIKARQTRVMNFVGGLRLTTSGAVHNTTDQIKDAVDTGKAVIDTVKGGVEDVKDRVDIVQEGVEKIQEGKKLIEEGMGQN
ncbi:hypothetical protein KKF55_05660 [Patescibacteria group bacterium]|nr:hypothetical protein [Patescibacteria group bacterium]